MEFTVTIPDDLIDEALAAAKRSNDRQAEEHRLGKPITFDGRDILNIAVNFLTGLILTDLQEQAQRDMTQGVEVRKRDISSRVLAANPIT